MSNKYSLIAMATLDEVAKGDGKTTPAEAMEFLSCSPYWDAKGGEYMVFHHDGIRPNFMVHKCIATGHWREGKLGSAPSLDECLDAADWSTGRKPLCEDAP